VGGVLVLLMLALPAYVGSRRRRARDSGGKKIAGVLGAGGGGIGKGGLGGSFKGGHSAGAGAASGRMDEVMAGRGFHTSTFRLNVSTLCLTGYAIRDCLGGV